MGNTGKRLVKELARPALHPLLVRMAYIREHLASLDAQVQNLQIDSGQRLAAVEIGVRNLETRMNDVERQQVAAHKTLEEFLDAISQQNALARETRREQVRIEETRVKNLRDTWEIQSNLAESISSLEARLEFIRKEIMLEVRYGGRDVPGEVETPDTQILDKAKLKSRPLRLNLGCGHIPVEGFVNVDGRPLPGVDVVADVGRLPVEPGDVDEIRSSHLLEHFPRWRLEELLRYWFDLLRPGGLFVAVVPDAESMIRTFVAGEVPWEDLKEVTFGGQEYSGDFHFAMFSQEDLTRALAAAGFVDVKIAEAGRRNGACLEMEAVAYKPAAD
jgi:predicted SAM-dependent methyltransferase